MVNRKKVKYECEMGREKRTYTESQENRREKAAKKMSVEMKMSFVLTFNSG